MTELTWFEPAASALLLAAAGVAMVMSVRRRYPAAVVGVVLLSWLALSLAVGWAMGVARPNPVDPALRTDRPIEVHEQGYVTSDTCRTCHPHHYHTWRHSYHSQMTQVAGPDTVVAPFDVTLQSYGKTFKLERVGDEFWIELDDPDFTGEGAPERVRRQIVMTTGSHHEQDYWYVTPHGRWVGRLPFVYRIAEKTWIPDASVLLTPPDAPQPFGLWNTNCIQCHTTFGRPRVIGMTDSDTRVAEFGIACEACHGPSERHVAQNANPKRRYELWLSDRTDDQVVNPRTLPPQRSAMVCGQCHGIWELKGRDAKMRWVGEGFAYRPGDDLNETRFYLGDNENLEHPQVRELLRDNPRFLDERFWSDGMVRVSGREYNGLIETPCYTHDNPTRPVMTCLSCHVLHKPADDHRPIDEWTDDQLKIDMRTNLACTQCHDTDFDTDAKLTAHSHHEPQSTGSNCYNCHMPFTVWGLLKAIRSHQVDSPTVQASIDTGRPNACNQCHLDKTLAWSAEHLDKWYGQPKPELNEVERRIPASMIWSIRGDAGQRALMAWTFGWEAAHGASGVDWLAPLLAPLLDDPYDAVRFAAYQSLLKVPGFVRFAYDFVAPRAARRAASERAVAIWSQRRAAAGEPTNIGFLFDDPDRRLPGDILLQLYQQRDRRGMHLAE